jgi:2-oxoglutarate ferredoxin oxidoreductase subunit delta
MSEELTETEAVQVAESKSKPKKKRKKGNPVIFPNWCKGCALCVEFCPKKVLRQMESGRVEVAHPDRCIACHWCELHCPDFAIFVNEVEVEEEA